MVDDTARNWSISFPLLGDPTNVLADAFPQIRVNTTLFSDAIYPFGFMNPAVMAIRIGAFGRPIMLYEWFSTEEDERTRPNLDSIWKIAVRPRVECPLFVDPNATTEMMQEIVPVDEALILRGRKTDGLRHLLLLTDYVKLRCLTISECLCSSLAACWICRVCCAV